VTVRVNTSTHERREEEMLKKLLNKLLKDEGGQDIIEYALLGAFISIAAVLIIRAIGPLLVTIYTGIRDALTPGP
jgi:Flp pilus assembly pilin Flp